MKKEPMLPTTQSTESTNAFLDETESPQGLLLPAVSVIDGTFRALPGNDQADIDVLPDGSKARTGIFIAKRVGVLSWKVDFDAKAEDESPAFVAFAPDCSLSDVALIGKAVKARQMVAKPEKHVYDFKESGVGHLKPILELLVWFPEVGFSIVTTSPNYHNAVDGVSALKKLINPDTGAIGMTPCSMKPSKKPHKSGSWSWESSFCDTTPLSKEDSVSLLEAFKAYQDIVKENQLIRENVDKWIGCLDAPMTEEIREALNKGVALNPPKY